ncbi:OPA3-domain-containing protein [Armillaria solidipes]|uniref:OPA3-domain-containing protein n=1 Tax=Armillaria solidipes TaxID=1076256 RepID=A0A2H3BGU0_9AGAR|nr:OPA3-domain-containing protein [Armillaria solidipes]
MASAKVATLLIRTIAKPISSTLKEQAKRHDRFRTFCVSLAQRMYRAEVKLRTGLLGEPAKHIRPLSEQKAIDNGANALAEGFLFGVAALLIIGETWRSSRSQSKRRDDVNDKLDELGTQVTELKTRMNLLTDQLEQRDLEQQLRNDELTRILERVVEIGLRGGWAEFEDTPLQFPRISLAPTASSVSHSPLPPDDTRIDVNTPDKDTKSSNDKPPSP